MRKLRQIDNLNLEYRENDKYFVVVHLKGGKTLKFGSDTELNSKDELINTLRQKAIYIYVSTLKSGEWGINFSFGDGYDNTSFFKGYNKELKKVLGENKKSMWLTSDKLNDAQEKALRELLEALLR